MAEFLKPFWREGFDLQRAIVHFVGAFKCNGNAIVIRESGSILTLPVQTVRMLALSLHK